MGKYRKQNHSDKEDREQLDAGNVEIFSVAVDEPSRTVQQRRMKIDSLGELGKSLINQVIAYVNSTLMHTRVFAIARCRVAREIKRDLGHLRFRAIGVSRDKCNAFAVQLAALELHARVSLRGVLTKSCIEHNERLDQEDQVSICYGSQALEPNRQLRIRHVFRRMQQDVRFLEQQLEQTVLEKWSNIPQLVDGQRLPRLQLADEGRKSGTGEVAIDCSKVHFRNPCDARLFLLPRNYAREPGYQALPVRNSRDRSAQKAWIGAKIEQRGVRRDLSRACLRRRNRQLRKFSFQALQRVAGCLHARWKHALVVRPVHDVPRVGYPRRNAKIFRYAIGGSAP